MIFDNNLEHNYQVTPWFLDKFWPWCSLSLTLTLTLTLCRRYLYSTSQRKTCHLIWSKKVWSGRSGQFMWFRKTSPIQRWICTHMSHIHHTKPVTKECAHVHAARTHARRNKHTHTRTHTYTHKHVTGVPQHIEHTHTHTHTHKSKILASHFHIYTRTRK